jgi:hypothetical protein
MVLVVVTPPMGNRASAIAIIYSTVVDKYFAYMVFAIDDFNFHRMTDYYFGTTNIVDYFAYIGQILGYDNH